MDEIRELTSVITNVNDLVAAIATAVEEQSVSTSEISTNISQAALGINEVNENVSQSSAVSGYIAGEINANSVTVNTQSTDLTNLTAQLNSLAQQFKV